MWNSYRGRPMPKRIFHRHFVRLVEKGQFYDMFLIKRLNFCSNSLISNIFFRTVELKCAVILHTDNSVHNDSLSRTTIWQKCWKFSFETLVASFPSIRTDFSLTCHRLLSGDKKKNMTDRFNLHQPQYELHIPFKPGSFPTGVHCLISTKQRQST